MAKLNNKLWIKGTDGTTSSVSIYTTEVEAGANSFHVLATVGGECYSALGSINDSTATKGRIKKPGGETYAILTDGGIVGNYELYSDPGSYGWFPPSGVSKVKVTIAGGGGGGGFNKNAGTTTKGGDGELVVLNNLATSFLSITVGAGGTSTTADGITGSGSDGRPSNVIDSNYDIHSAAGGKGATSTTDGTGGTGGGKGGTGNSAGGNGWVLVQW